MADDLPDEPGPVVDILLEDSRWLVVIPDIERIAPQAVAGVVRAHADMTGPWEACVVLTNDARIRELNRQYRQKDKPTNVLSFQAWNDTMPEADGMPVALGDVVLALETIEREAGEQGKTVRDHAMHLLVHGAMHLLGFDHETGEEADMMEAKEAALLAQWGIADPYREREGV